MDNIMLKIKAEGNCVAVKTYSRTAAGHGRFLISTRNLHDWLACRKEETFYDTDCGNILQLSVRGGQYKLKIWWLSESYGGRLSGVVQEMEINLEDFEAAINSAEWQKILCKDAKRPYAQEWTASAQRVLANIAQHKQMRRAFCKAMKQGSLQWPDTKFKIYADSQRSFYFTTDCGICGGLICHEYDGKYQYSVHT